MKLSVYEQDGVQMPLFDASTNGLVFNILKTNSSELCSSYTKTDATSNGIEYSWDGNTCTLDGSNPSNVSLNNIVYKANGVPSSLIPGEKYYVEVSGLTDKLTFRMQYEDTNHATKTTTLTESDWITIPSDVGAYFLLRLYVTQGASFTDHEVTVNIYPMHFSSAGNGQATPQMYGAVGDGVTDDTAAMQACLDNNTHVYLPDGTYLISSALNIKIQGQTITGSGRTSVIKASGCNAFNFVTAYYNVSLENFSVQGGGTSAYVGFKFDAITFNYTFKNLYIHDFKYGFQLNTSDSVNGKHNVNTLISQCEVSNCDIGIQILNTSVSQVNALKVDKTYVHLCGTGLNVTGNVIDVESCIIEHNDVGILIDASESGLANTNIYAGSQSITIEKSYFEKNIESTIRVDSSYDTTIGKDAFVKCLTISNNYIYMDDSQDTTHPVFDFNSAKNPYISDGYKYTDRSGCVYSNVIFYGNTIGIPLSMHMAKTLIDGHNLLGSDCVFNLGMSGSHGWNDSDNKCYIISNMGRAVVNDAFGFKKKRAFLDGGTKYRFNVIPISIDVSCSSGSGTLTLYGYPKSSATKTTIASTSVSSGDNALDDSSFDSNVNMGDIDTFEIELTGTMTVDDPIITYISQCV